VATVTAVHRDGPLILSRQRFADAVAAVVDPVPARINGAYRWKSSLYSQLRAELAGGRKIHRGAQQRSRLPCRLEVLALLIMIDDTVAGWAPGESGTTVALLHGLTERRWRPQDTAQSGPLPRRLTALGGSRN
jgi:hypothetical protein